MQGHPEVQAAAAAHDLVADGTPPATLPPCRYRDFDHRDTHRAASGSNAEWQDGYLAHSRRCLSQQESSIFVPTAGVMAAAGAAPVQDFAAPVEQAKKPALYELRQYQVRGQ